MADELRVPIAIPVETNASDASDSIKELRDSIARSKDAVKEQSALMRDLKGKTEDVAAAKLELKGKIRQEEAAIAAATVKLLKHGAGYDDVSRKAKVAGESTDKVVVGKKKEADATKKAADASKAGSESMASSMGAAGAPVASLKAKLGSLGETLGGTEGVMTALASVAAMAAAAIVAVGAAAGAAALSLGKFILVSADAERMMQLTRKANLNGNDQWAKNLGDQVDAIARKVPIAKDKLNELGISLAKSRIGGQTMVDTMNAVAGASAAAGDDLGNKLKGIVERGALSKRFQLSPQELLGMDLDFNDVAKAYASGMHVSVEAARRELASGRVKLADGASALKRAVDSKFGDINADKLLGFDNQLAKFKNDLVGLTKDVDITPILKGIKSLADNFDQTSANGKALRGIVTTIGKSIGVTFQDGVPILQDFIDKGVYGALKLENYWLRAKIAFASVFGPKVSFETTIFKTLYEGMALFFPVIKIFESGAGTLALFAKSIDTVLGAVSGLKASLESIDWSATGANIVDGLVGGLASGATRLVDKVKGLANDVKSAFTSTLRIQSPSKEFFEYGKQIGAGAEGGIVAGTPSVRAAAAALAPVPGEGAKSASASGGAASGRGAVQITFSPQITVQGAGGDVGAQLRDPALLQPLTELFLSMIRAAGIEVPA